MKILYLDQNKWIELARAQKAPLKYPAQQAVLSLLVEESNAGRLLVPLTATNLYETHKIDIQERREHLAWVQATLSQGMVFRPAPPFKSASFVKHLPTSTVLASPFWPSEAVDQLQEGLSIRVDEDTFYGSIDVGAMPHLVPYLIENAIIQ